jgi:hypothetical protein
VSQEFWHADPNGELSATVHGLRLIIRRCDGFSRYLILQRSAHGNYPEIMVGSGTESDVSKAMVAARRAAMRTDFILSHRLKMKIGMRRNRLSLERKGYV